MAFIDMYSELSGCVPKIPVSYCKTLVNRAYKDIRRKNLWSFQLYEANWVSPALINAGSATTTLGSNQVIFDATASAALTPLILAGPFPTNLLQRQFRVGTSTIYNIWGTSVTGGILTITLDRPYADVPGTGGYMVYQCYYPAPVADHWNFMGVRDIVNFNDLGTLLTREAINLRDPQRTIFYLPTEVVYYRNEPNPNSQQYGFPVYELWGQSLYVLTYQLYGIRKGAPLVNDSDTLPGPFGNPIIGEDCVMALARNYAYEWAEANKGDVPRNGGTNWPFLLGKSMADFNRLWKEYRKEDRETVDNWFEIRHRRGWLGILDGWYNSISGQANAGAPW
jgi:hypothetical protein